MAESIGLASGLLTLTLFALQSSAALYNTIQSFQSHQKRVRDLVEELEALNGVLQPLKDTLQATNSLNLSSLELPLRRCGDSCKEFEQELLKCSSRSTGGRTSFRDWAKLRYMGDDVDGFRRLLAGYKLTICIALTDANLRKSSVTAEQLESYKDLINTATDDLQIHLESIDEKLEAIFRQNGTESNQDVTELKRIKEERLSTQKCLQICDQLSSHISQIQLTPQRGTNSPGLAESDEIPERIANEGLQECKNSLALTVARLEKHMKDVIDRLVTKSKTTMNSDDDVADLARLQDEWTTARQCMDICSKAESHLKENVSNIDNYATGDALQFMVSTNGKVLHGKNRGLGWRTRQVGGYLSDNTVVQLSRDMSNATIRNTGKDDTSSWINTAPIPNDNLERTPASDFDGRHGRGFTLISKPATDQTIPSTRSPENGR